MITRREALRLMATTGVAASALAGCGRQVRRDEAPDDARVRRLRVLATSDTHGMFVPWDYPLDEEDGSGSMAQLATAVRELRDEDTLLVDAGDTIQDNMAEIFLADEVHPMISCMNAIGYDIGITGNHEYNFGMDVVRKTVATFAGTVLTGNVTDEDGAPIADGCAIVDKGGIRVGVIGMVTPNIARWDAVNLEGCVVSDPVEETRSIIDQIHGDVDVLIGLMHMGLDNEYGVEHSGVRDLAEACPEFDLIVAAHTHQLVEGEEVNGVLVVENKYHAQTMAVVDLTLVRDGSGWKVTERSSNPVSIADYDPDPDIVELMDDYDARAKRYAREVIGTLEGESLAPADEIEGIPRAVVEDTAVIDLVHEVQLYRTGADVSSTALTRVDSNMGRGPIRRCDISRIYTFANTLYTLEMTGAQLRTYLEWSAGFFRQYREGDVTLAFDPDTPLYNYDMLQGVRYQVNVAREPGRRIEGLSWPDGRAVADGDSFVIVVNNYRATTQLLTPGMVFEEGDMPRLLEADVHGGLGVREMLGDYVENVKGGRIVPACDDNWRIVGNDWDVGLHQRAAELLAEGAIALELDDRHLACAAITVDDLAKAQ